MKNTIKTQWYKIRNPAWKRFLMPSRQLFPMPEKSRRMVSIILLNWNGKPVLKECLDSIKRNTSYPNFETIVIDQGSVDGSKEMMKSKYKWVQIIENPTNYGIPKASNQGFAKAKGNYFMLMSNDTVTTPGWMTAMVDLMESDNHIASIGATLVGKGESEAIKPVQFEKKRASVCSATMLMKRRAFEHLGGYDEASFSPYGGDETDWNLRAWNAGYRVLETKRAIIEHVGSHDTKKQNPDQYILLNEGRLRAMLYNLGLLGMIKRLPGLGLILVQSFSDGKTIPLLKTYWNNLKQWRRIAAGRKKRNQQLQKFRKEQAIQGERWF